MISGQRKVYDFKSVGEDNETFENDRNVFNQNLPIGIKTPLQFGNDSDGLFAMHHNLLDQIKDNLKNLLLTNHGERVGLYDFGANLLPLATELGTDKADREAIRRISKSISKYLPFVVPKNFIPLVEDPIPGTGMARVGVRIEYDVPTLGVVDQKIEVVITAIG